MGRGLREETLREFGVGFAPNKWDTVYLRGQQAGYQVEELVAAGLVKKGTKGGFLDHFRARIMFPIRDARGRMQGLGRQGDEAGAAGEVRELAGGRAVPEEPHAVRDRAGAERRSRRRVGRSWSRATRM